MTVSATSAAQTAVTNTALNAGAGTTLSSKSTLGYDAFLKLFMAQLKNQDPTSPKDPSEFVAELATFSNVEQSIRTNLKLDSMMTLSALSQANNLIGRTVTSSDGTVSGKVAAIHAVSGGAIAELDNGKRVTLGDGVKIT